ncbi:MAG: cytochrome c4 [Pseudomonadales bacterium]|nr:cytochrome c4 [Pseudomonadales bacterium]
MRKLTLGILLLLGFSGTVAAQADIAAGQAKAAICGACHGADGNSMIGAFPKLAGQNVPYLVKQMKNIKSGDRPVMTMAGQLDSFSVQDMENVAAYFSSQTVKLGTANPELVDLGEKLYRSGSKRKGVSACTACHSPTGSGNAPAGFPSLKGQHAEYTALQLKAFRSGERHNDAEKIMRDNAELLSDKDIDALASYISGLR